MTLPRGLGSDDLAGALARLGYRVSRQGGSHIRLTTDRGGQHHVTVPKHDPIRIGTLASILRDVAAHFGRSRSEIEDELFG